MIELLREKYHKILTEVFIVMVLILSSLLLESIIGLVEMEWFMLFILKTEEFLT
jgi:hypothetical protein